MPTREEIALRAHNQHLEPQLRSSCRSDAHADRSALADDALGERAK